MIFCQVWACGSPCNTRHFRKSKITDASPAPYVSTCVQDQSGSYAPAEAAQPSPDALPFWWGYQKAPWRNCSGSILCVGWSDLPFTCDCRWSAWPVMQSPARMPTPGLYNLLGVGCTVRQKKYRCPKSHHESRQRYITLLFLSVGRYDHSISLWWWQRCL